MKEKQSKKIIILILIFIIILIYFYNIANAKENMTYEDLIFFQLWNRNKKENISAEIENEVKQYPIEIKKGKKTYKDIYLWQTLDTKTLVNEKIAPGTQGNFEIILKAKETMQYEIKLSGKNEKPKNFEFIIQEPIGIIKKDEIKVVKVNWKWQYEINNEEDKQDTKDGQTIRKYYFDICVIGS